MKRKVGVLVGVGICALALSASAISIGSNITIFDGATGRTPTAGVGVGMEDQETDYGATWAQEWDLEGFFWDAGTRTLTGVGGFDFKNGTGGQKAGDLFIDINGDAKIPAVETVPASLQGFDYCIDFAWNDYGPASLGYKIVDLTDPAHQPVILQTSWSSRLGSDPYRLVSGGLVLGTGVAGYTTGLTDADVGLLGGTHNAFSINLSWLAAKSFTVHETMTCGNDGFNGHVPDGGAMVTLLGIALVGIGALKRKMR